jgi:hypothetical protein
MIGDSPDRKSLKKSSPVQGLCQTLYQQYWLCRQLQRARGLAHFVVADLKSGFAAAVLIDLLYDC